MDKNGQSKLEDLKRRLRQKPERHTSREFKSTLHQNRFGNSLQQPLNNSPKSITEPLPVLDLKEKWKQERHQRIEIAKAERQKLKEEYIKQIQNYKTNNSDNELVKEQDNLDVTILPVNSPPTPQNLVHVTDSPELSDFYQKVDRLIQPGQLIQCVVKKPKYLGGNSQFDLSNQRFDILKNHIRINSEIQLQNSSKRHIYDMFYHQSLEPDITIEKIQFCQNKNYIYLEITTKSESYKIQIYPLPQIPKNLFSKLQFCQPVIDALNLPGLSAHGGQTVLIKNIPPLKLQYCLLENPSSFVPAVSYPIGKIEPLYDISKAIRRGLTIQHEYTVYLDYGAKTHLKAQLKCVNTNAILSEFNSDIQKYNPPKALDDCIQMIKPHLIQTWTESKTQKWYFTGISVSENSKNRVYQSIGFLFWEHELNNFVVPYIFEFIYDASGETVFPHWTGRISPSFILAYQEKLSSLSHHHLNYKAMWEPADYIQDILSRLPLVLDSFSFSPYFAPYEAICFDLKLRNHPQKPFQNTNWQTFFAQTHILNDVFQLLKHLSIYEDTSDKFDQQLKILLKNPQIDLPMKRHLKQRLLEYKSSISQAIKHGDNTHYIYTFWQAFFKVLFKSMPVPTDFKHLQKSSIQFDWDDNEAHKSLQVFQTPLNDCDLRVTLEMDRSTQVKSLKYINLSLNNLGLTLNHCPFAFIQSFHKLPAVIKDTIAPHWKYFGLIKELYKENNHDD